MSQAITREEWTYDEQGNKVHYEIVHRLLDVPFKIMWSANAWWRDKGKVDALFEGFVRRYTIQEASVFAGISYDQYDYFKRIHPNFSVAKQRLESYAPMSWKGTVLKAAKTDWKAAMSLLERDQPEQYGLQRAMGKDLPNRDDSVLEIVEHSMFDERGEIILNEKMQRYLLENHGSTT